MLSEALSLDKRSEESVMMSKRGLPDGTASSGDWLIAAAEEIILKTPTVSAKNSVKNAGADIHKIGILRQEILRHSSL
jgi:hypothetical protein